MSEERCSRLPARAGPRTPKFTTASGFWVSAGEEENKTLKWQRGAAFKAAIERLQVLELRDSRMEGAQGSCALYTLSTILLKFRLLVEVKLFGNLLFGK